jgi:hypothetical protein
MTTKKTIKNKPSIEDEAAALQASTDKKQTTAKKTPPGQLNKEEIELRNYFAGTFINANFPAPSHRDPKNKFAEFAGEAFDFAASMVREAQKRGVGL